MPESLPSRWFLSTAAPTSRERLIALVIIAVAFAAFLATLPVVRVPLARIPAFIPAYQAALFVIDLVTAVLLFGQFMRLRTAALLALAAGYLFDAAMILPHTLSFPDVFAPTGLLAAGEQTTAWLYVFWHGGFPLFVLLYVHFRNSETVLAENEHAGVAMLTVTAVLLLAAALTALTTLGHDHLPRVMQGSDYSMLVTKGVSPAIWLLSFATVVAVWRRAVSVLDLWLAVVMVVWLFDITLAAVFDSSRFDLGFYAGRLYGLIAASIVLIALLTEMVRLYGRLAAALELAEARNTNLLRSREALAAAQRMEAIGQLTGVIAHDFNNLLTVICGNLELVRKNTADAARVERLAANAESAAKRAVRLTRQLLAFGGRQTSRPAAIDVSRLIQDFEPVLQRTAEGTELLTGLTQGVHPILVDPGQMEIALANLIGNARDAAGGNGRIVLETRNVNLTARPFGDEQTVTPGDYVLVAVRDTGPGMTAEVAARAFEPFFTTKESAEGSGLGLSQVYGFVKSAGGHLRLETQPDRGTSVLMFFPRTVRPASVAAPPAAPAAAATAVEAVLVVEDDADVREITVAAVADLGYAVREAASAEEALERLRTDADIALMFSDIVMPGGMSGVELAAEARRLRPTLKVLLTSGNAGAILSRQEFADGDLEILEKPYPHRDLAERLSAMLARA